jgi:hypothetical protein
MRVFDFGGLQAANLQSSAACRQHVPVASPKSRTCCAGVVLVNCQLSGGADTRQGGRPASRGSSLFFTRNFLADALLRISMKLSARNNVLAKELAVLCAMNTKISFKSLSRSSAKPSSLEQVIDLIDTARGWAAEIGTELSKRREFLRFPITRCNLLHLWSLCHIPFRATVGIVGILYDSVLQAARKSRDYIMA